MGYCRSVFRIIMAHNTTFRRGGMKRQFEHLHQVQAGKIPKKMMIVTESRRGPDLEIIFTDVHNCLSSIKLINAEVYILDTFSEGHAHRSSVSHFGPGYIKQRAASDVHFSPSGGTCIKRYASQSKISICGISNWDIIAHKDQGESYHAIKFIDPI